MFLENRPKAINDIRQKLDSIPHDEKLQSFDMSELKEICSQILNEDKFDVKCFQTDRALTYLDHLRSISQQCEDDQDLNRAYEYS